MIKSIFFDIDGTLLGRGLALPGAVAAVDEARRRGLELRFLTNITSREPAAIAAELREQGFTINDSEIQTATTACVEYLRSQPDLCCHLLVPASVRHLFEGINIDDLEPNVVVIGDIGEQFNYEVLNRVFLMLRAGAELVVPQKGLFWFDRDGPKLDSGSFIIGLEAATGKRALVTGKPTELFFQRALTHVGCQMDEVLVIGDDLSTDVHGAAQVGAHSALVGTGKYIPGAELNATDRPDYFLPTLEQLPTLLDALG